MSDQETQTVVNRFNVGIFFSLTEENELSRAEEREWVLNHPFFKDRSEFKLITHEKGKYLAYLSGDYEKLHGMIKSIRLFRQEKSYKLNKLRMSTTANYENAGVYTFFYYPETDKVICSHDNKEKGINRLVYSVYSPVQDTITRANDVLWAIDTKYVSNSLEFDFSKPKTLTTMILATTKLQYPAVFKTFCGFLVAIGKQNDFRALGLVARFNRAKNSLLVNTFNPFGENHEQHSKSIN